MSPPPVCVAGVAYELPAQEVDLETLASRGLLQSTAAQLRESGFERCRVADVPASTLAQRAVARLLEETGTAPESVGLLVNGCVMPPSALVPDGGARSVLGHGLGTTHLTRYAGTRIQHELGLVQVRTVGVSEVGCVALLEAVWLAHRLMDQEGCDTAICVSADVMPEGFLREVHYSLMSDAACAVLLRRDPAGHRILQHGQMTKGFYWDAQATLRELLAAYYVTGKRLIAGTLARCGLTLDDIACVLPNNASAVSWRVMCEVLGLPIDRVYIDNIARHGHAMASDQFINLHDARRAGRVRRGDRVLLFGFGLGAHWACSVLEI
jgi:3-oxoacyl-[acyl-carrier-protein] synthase-3